MEKEIRRILDGGLLYTVFQPVVDLRDGGVTGYEALSRISGESFIGSIDDLFTQAVRCGCLWELELLCRTRALEASGPLFREKSCKKLFLNVNPGILHDPAYVRGLTGQRLAEYGIAPDQVVFEISERSMTADLDAFTRIVTHYRTQGFKVAIDDVGAGFSGLNRISIIRPDYIKLDMHLIRDVHRDRLKYSLLRGMAEFARSSGSVLVGEGIECREEMETLARLGIHCGQGYYILRPARQVAPVREEIRNILQKSAHRGYDGPQLVQCVGDLCSGSGIVNPDGTVEDVYSIFLRDPGCRGLTVVENGMPAGILTREKMALKLSGQYGFNLHRNKPVSHLMDRDFLQEDENEPVSEVSRRAMGREPDRLYDFIVVTREGRYSGTVTIRDLLTAATASEVQAARHTNPLSGLPGNLLIEQALNRYLSSNESYAIYYIDIDCFKIFNDTMGFGAGDRVIMKLAELLRSMTAQEGFAGHVGGDDFVAVMPGRPQADFGASLNDLFIRETAGYYRDDVLERGYVTGTDRSGAPCRFPLLQLTVAGTRNTLWKNSTTEEMTRHLARRKVRMKQDKIQALQQQEAMPVAGD